ncbi:finTRIM family, member 14 [Silurus meridionalis]|nr:finTRIM family, member 14 [Silurus meridionalis]
MARILVDQNQFICTVCLDLLKDPVAIPCGHSFCKVCINSCWDQEDYKGVFSCPQCRDTFNSRPVLRRNNMLAEVVEKLKKSGIQAPSPAHHYAGLGDVECDFCTEKKHNAIKSCLVCVASYCETHLRPHYVSPAFKNHTLIEASTKLQEKICTEHNKLIEIYCRTDQTCICYLCTMDKHKGHDTVTVSGERAEKQSKLKEEQMKSQRKIQDRQKKVQELTQALNIIKRVLEDSEKIFTEMISSMEKKRSEVRKLIIDQEKAELSRPANLLEQLEQEIADLQKKVTELEQLSHTNDHIHFLQTELKEEQMKFQQRIQEKQKKVQELKQAVNFLSAQTAVDDSEKIFTEMISSMEKKRSEVTELIRDQEKAELSRPERLLEQLEQEISDLQRRITEQEQLSHTHDHIHFLQSFQSLCVSAERRSPTEIRPDFNTSSITVYQHHLADGMRNYFSDLKKRLEEIYEEEFNKIPSQEPGSNSSFQRNKTDLSFSMCRKMAEASISVDQDQFICPVCLDLLNDPVTIHCGHSFCKVCINGHWDEEYRKGVYSCPQCRDSFPSRPDLRRNNMLAEVVEKLKKFEVQSSALDHCNTGPGDVECDFCTGRKHKAIKSCLMCLASFCEIHLKPHLDVPCLTKHTLIEASVKLQEKICSKHDKLIEIYCRTDQTCICYLCTMDEHKGHDTITALAGKAEKQTELKEEQMKFQQRIQEKQKKVQELKQAVNIIKLSAQTAVDDSEKIFTEMISSMEKKRSEVTELIRDQERAELSRAERLLEQLEQEISDLQRRITELEQLSHTHDHIHFLQSFSRESCTFSAGVRSPPSKKKDFRTSSIPVHQQLSFDGVKNYVSDLKKRLEEFCAGEFHKILPHDFCYLTLDHNTAHRYLILSEKNRAVSYSESLHQYSNHPERFDSCIQILSIESMCGRCYWEVEWSGVGFGGVSISVSYKDISRKGWGDKCVFGRNDQSWSLWCYSSSLCFYHNNIKTDLGVPSPSRIGVYVDQSAGTLSFYSVSDMMKLLYKVHTTFTQPLYAGFGFGALSNTELKEEQMKFHQRIQEKQKKVQELKQDVNIIKLSAQTAVDDSEKMFTELINLIEKKRSEVREMIRDQEKAELSRAERLLEQLEQEISDLQRRITELEQLSHTHDHIHFLQSFQSLHVSAGRGSPSADRPNFNTSIITLHQQHLSDKMRNYFSDLKKRLEEFCKEKFNRIPVQDFSYLNLDLNTAHYYLILSEKNRVVRYSQIEQRYSDHPERFDSCIQVLSKESVCGRCYWEVEWSSDEGVYISVSYKDISRKGRDIECRFGRNNQSWSLRCSSSPLSFFHNNIKTDLRVPSPSRIGVYVDHSAGTLSFYSVSDTMKLLHRVHTTFTQPLYAGFGINWVAGSMSTELKEEQMKSQQRIQQKQKKVQELKQAVNNFKLSAQTAVDDSEKMFTEMISSMEKKRSEMTELIRDQEKAEVSRAERLLEQLEQEISDLQRRITELEQLSHTHDHIHFLQTFQSLRVSFECEDSSSITVNQHLSFDDVRKSVSDLKKQLEEFSVKELTKFPKHERSLRVLLNPSVLHSHTNRL